MAQTRQPLPVTLEVVVVALAPQLPYNSSSNGSTTPFTVPDIDLTHGNSDAGSILNGGDSLPHGSGGVGEPGATAFGGMVSVSYIAMFSTLFCIVGLVGLTGNVLVVYIVLKDRKMRKSVTNLLILNLAVADSVLMVLGVPEIAQFMLDRGWLLGLAACRVNRSVLVAALYASVLTLVAVCIER
ncbi:hypothetical protein ACOMHN_037423 [Nucella lapillus]